MLRLDLEIVIVRIVICVARKCVCVGERLIDCGSVCMILCYWVCLWCVCIELVLRISLEIYYLSKNQFREWMQKD